MAAALLVGTLGPTCCCLAALLLTGCSQQQQLSQRFQFGQSGSLGNIPSQSGILNMYGSLSATMMNAAAGGSSALPANNNSITGNWRRHSLDLSLSNPPHHMFQQTPKAQDFADI